MTKHHLISYGSSASLNHSTKDAKPILIPTHLQEVLDYLWSNKEYTQLVDLYCLCYHAGYQFDDHNKIIIKKLVDFTNITLIQSDFHAQTSSYKIFNLISTWKYYRVDSSRSSSKIEKALKRVCQIVDPNLK